MARVRFFFARVRANFQQSLFPMIGMGLSALFAAETASAETQKYQPSQQALAQEVEERIMRISEFQFIRQEAERLGIKVYLFGGTASAYAHYVRQDLAREAGDKRYPEMLYDYDYTNIFRSTQDLDVVVDGDASKAEELEAALRKKFPHFIGDKGAKWEVRPLREARGEKEAILNNPDFMNQHTDSHSTGMVEITKPARGEVAIKDVRDWGSKTPQFLKDVQSQQLHYYFSPQHATTSRAAKGLNPPILSVIRYLTKAFQYDLEISPEDKKQISKIIKDFQPKSLRDKDYLERWVEKNGKKLFEHAVDIENAWDTLEELGLRKKLIAIQNNAGKIDSLSWLMSKEPLRSKPIGSGKGKTAAQIAKEMKTNKLIVAHETNSYLAYESITRSKAGDLNAFISRKDSPGESAMLGNGFYSKIGRKGAKGTGMTIRMEIDPKAREGTDFIRLDDIIVLKNRNAVHVMPEQIELSVLEYFKTLAEGKEFSNDDRALFESFRRRTNRAGFQNPNDEQEIYRLMKEAVASKRKLSDVLLQEWFAFPFSQEHPEIVEAIIDKGKNGEKWVKKTVEVTGDQWLLQNTSEHSFWREHPEWLETIIQRKTADADVIHYFLRNDYWLEKHPEWVQTIINRRDGASTYYAIVHDILFNPISRKHPEWMQSTLDSGMGVEWVVEALNKPHWQDMPELVDRLLSTKQSSIYAQEIIDKEVARHILSQPYSAKHPGWLKTILSRGLAEKELIEDALSQPHWAKQAKLVLKMFKDYLHTGQATMADELAEHILSKPHWKELVDTQLVNSLLRGYHKGIVFQHILSKPHYALEHPEWIEKALQNEDSLSLFSQHVLSQPFSAEHPEWVTRVLKSGGYYLVTDAFTQPHWAGKPELLLETLKVQMSFNHVSLRDWEKLLSLPHWRDDPVLLEATKRNLNIENLMAAVKKGYKSKLPTKSARSCAASFKSLD